MFVRAGDDAALIDEGDIVRAAEVPCKAGDPASFATCLCVAITSAINDVDDGMRSGRRHDRNPLVDFSGVSPKLVDFAKQRYSI